MPEWASQDNLQSLLNQLTDGLRGLPREKVRKFLYAVILVSFLSILADIFWLLMPMPNNGKVENNIHRLSASVNNASQGKRSASGNTMDFNITSLKAWNLFGAAAVNEVGSDTPNKPEVDTESLPVSRLQLRLLGVMENWNKPELSQAVIADASEADLYKVGDELPAGNNVTLARVLTKEVVIDNRGKYETLKLYEENETGRPASRKPASRQSASLSNEKTVIDHSSNERLSEIAEGYRQQLLKNPMSLAEVIRVSVAKDEDGKLMGYRIRPGRDRKQFAEFGLRSGDIVTSINGVPLDDPTRAMQLYGDLRNAREATFVVQRGNEEINLIVGLSN